MPVAAQNPTSRHKNTRRIQELYYAQIPRMDKCGIHKYIIGQCAEFYLGFT